MAQRLRRIILKPPSVAPQSFDAIQTVYGEDGDPEEELEESYWPAIFQASSDIIQAAAFGEELDEEDDTDNWVGYLQDYVDASFLPPVDSGELDEEDDTDNFGGGYFDYLSLDAATADSGELDEEDDTDNFSPIIYDAAPAAAGIEWFPNAIGEEGEEEDDTEAFASIIYDAAPAPQAPGTTNYHSWLAKTGIKTKVVLASQVDGENSDTN